MNWWNQPQQSTMDIPNMNWEAVRYCVPEAIVDVFAAATLVIDGVLNWG